MAQPGKAQRFCSAAPAAWDALVRLANKRLSSDTDKTFFGLCLCHSCTLYGQIDNYKCAGGVQCPFDELSSMSSLSAFEQLSEEEEKKIRETGVGRSARPRLLLY